MGQYLSFDISNEGKHTVNTQMKSSYYCGVTKFLANVPSCLEGGDHGINVT